MNKLNKLISVISTAAAMTMLYPTTVMAQNTINLSAPGQWNSLNGATPGGLITNFIKLLLVVAALMFFIMLVVGGIQWIMAGGDKTGAENARKRITAALVGLVIVFVAWAIVNLVKILFGVDILNLTIPSLVGAT